jgi:hypothetical protein
MAQIDLNGLMQSAGMAVANSRKAVAEVSRLGSEHDGLKRELSDLRQNAVQLAEALGRAQVQRSQGDCHIQRIENIPGRRIPFDLLVDIAIPANSTGVQQGSIMISQEGPFVAVSRFAALVSAHEFQVTPVGGGAVAAFAGRSYGRYRLIHSAWDLNDGQPYSQVVQAQAFPGTGAPHVMSPSNASPFRSMSGDFRIKFENAGSSFPRSNLEVPSPFWTRAINEPFELGALDFFERGETLSFKVLPLHSMNAAFGNISGIGGIAPFPFSDSQWDGVEGIDDAVQALNGGTTDPVVRLPNAILTIGFHGYRIVQPAGAGPY